MSDQLRRRLKRVLTPLRATPFHPQWLPIRQHRNRSAWVAERATGDVLDVGAAGGAMRGSLHRSANYVSLDYPATACGLYGTRPDVFGDAAHLPFADQTFDTLLLMEVIEHLPSPELALAEAHRVLRKGGRLLVTVPFAYPMHDQPFDYQRFTEHGLIHRIRQAGLRQIAVDEIGSAVEAASGIQAMALAQGGVEAIASRSSRLLMLPLLPLMIVVANLSGWILARIAPAKGLMPGGYYVEARRT